MAWLIPHLMEKSLASVVVILTIWWMVLMTCLFWMWMWAIDVAMWFLMLASVTTRAIKESSEEVRAMLSRDHR